MVSAYRSVLSLVCLVGLPSLVTAQSPQALPSVNLGFTSFLDGAPPAGPGLYYAQYATYYGASRIMGSGGTPQPLPDPNLDVWVSLSQFIYMWDKPLTIGELELPGKFALDVVIPVISPDLDFSAPVPISASGTGLGDIVIGPAIQFDPIMDGKQPLFVHRLEAQFNLPTGRYDTRHLINPGSNFFSFNPYWAGTAFLTPKDTLSFRAHYLWCAKNHDPSDLTPPGTAFTQAGDAFHINFAMEHEFLPKMFRAGFNGYYLKQTTDAKLDGVAVPGSREQVLGIGPGFLLSFSQTQHLFCNLYWETDVKNRPEGFQMNLRHVYRF